MERQREKMVALMHISRMLPQHPGLFMLLGFLAARLDRLHFVATPDDADPAGARILLATPHARIWTGRWFRSWVGSAEVPDPVILISVLAERDTDIYLALDIGPRPAWLEAVLAPAEPASPPDPRERLDELRARVDQALDIYNECRRQLEQGDPQRRQELEFFLDLARREVEELGRELQRLKESLPAQEG
ncbi:hypothetical protein Tmar_1194 [Thermaerobacter marianensis DSM 12885]|uniref:IDEAL domain-containing protein n=1 Tax=Thermaerobacter marianensis (strain ATCC 700841 / DSM 12885 / JCM 10246 / 7p75a) TaxID=644966 RepID=E6SL76_THEM7|nr:hypothetical protein [Thermaerobacter marianensis]ADU51307.1 hypothetical protein Tmar_1194 [Thermaerobacter marianensis DSM 12885]